MKKVGVAGIGLMGAGIAASLMRNGFAVTVWNRSEAKCSPLVESGARLAASLPALASEADVVVTILRDDSVVRELVLEQVIPHMKAGAALIEMSTVTPAVSRALAEAVEPRGLHFIEAPVMGSKEAAENGQLKVLAGGSAETVQAQHDVLSAMAQKIIHVGPAGSSAYLKLACNQLVAATIGALGEGLALAQKGGVDRKTAVELFMSTLARVAGLKHPKIADKEWSTHFALDLMFKDLVQAQRTADDLHLPMPVLAAVTDVYERVRREGKGALDFSVVADPE
jgi:3-hydroxyisobutyrate dehydrogenase